MGSVGVDWGAGVATGSTLIYATCAALSAASWRRSSSDMAEDRGAKLKTA
jgi:hypothetical protein